jgi:hypothetical protein
MSKVSCERFAEVHLPEHCKIGWETFGWEKRLHCFKHGCYSKTEWNYKNPYFLKALKDGRLNLIL